MIPHSFHRPGRGRRAPVSRRCGCLGLSPPEEGANLRLWWGVPLRYTTYNDLPAISDLINKMFTHMGELPLTPFQEYVRDTGNNRSQGV